LGGGEAVAIDTVFSRAWLASFNGSTFTDLTGKLPAASILDNSSSSVLSIASSSQIGWIIGGYVNNNGMLLNYDNDTMTDLSGLAGDMSYVIWVGSQ